MLEYVRQCICDQTCKQTAQMHHHHHHIHQQQYRSHFKSRSIQLNWCYADTFVLVVDFVEPFVTGLWRTLTFPPGMPFAFLWLMKIVSSSLDTSDSDRITLLIWFFPWPENNINDNQSMLHTMNVLEWQYKRNYNVQIVVLVSVSLITPCLQCSNDLKWHLWSCKSVHK